MVQIGRLIKTWFAIQALMLLFLAAIIANAFLHRLQTGRLDPDDLAPALLWTGLKLVTAIAGGLIAGKAWLALQDAQPSARTWARLASVASLPILGIGTIIGIAGLVVFSRADVVEKLSRETQVGRQGSLLPPPLPAKPPAPLPGDGTSLQGDFWVPLIGSGGYIAGCVWWLRWWMREPHFHPSVLVLAAMLWPAFLVGIAVHELGHVIAGGATGMKLAYLQIGPCEWSLVNGRWRFVFKTVGLTGGRSMLVPVHFRNFGARRIAMLAGGPAASLLMAIGGSWLALTAPGRPWEWIWGFLAYLSTVGFMHFLMSLAPFRTKNQYSDGAQIYQMASKGKWAEVHLAIGMVSSTLVTRFRPRDCDIDLINRASAFLEQGMFGFVLRHAKLDYYQDCGKIPEALESLGEAEQLYPEVADIIMADQHADFVFVHALYRRDRVAARLWWDRMATKPPAQSRMCYLKARAALDWIEGRTSEARTAWEEGNKIARTLPPVGAYEFERWCFDLLGGAIESGTPAMDIGISDVTNPTVIT